jgi:ribonuclease HI
MALRTAADLLNLRYKAHKQTSWQKLVRRLLHAAHWNWNTGDYNRHKKKIAQSTTKTPLLPLEGDVVIYTDGSFIRNQATASWGYIVLQARDRHLLEITECYGQVITNPTDPHFLGAITHTNKTAEITAIAEALIWVKNDYTCRNVIIRYDSEYAARAIQGIYKNITKNIALIRKTQDLLTQDTSRTIKFDHVKAHSTDNWNNRVDMLAKQGRTHTSRDHDFETTIHGAIQHCILAAIVSNV